MTTCFVIQPFDEGPFDKRYEDVFVPAINAAGLEPYRVDRDPSAVIPIEEIEKGIRRADACLADISTPNPNVWFELGYAIAASKPVVLVCVYEKDKRFPFDIQHRSVITYRTESARDFQELARQISAKLSAALRKEDRLGQLAASSVIADVEGLSPIEIVALVTVAENADAPDEPVSIWSIRQDMERSGYTRIAVTIGLTSILRKGMLESERRVDEYDQPYVVYTVTPFGMQWLMNNQEKLILHHPKKQPQPQTTDNEIPF
jgi:nucleoside 2-deoxyribosyltransferase